MTTYTEYFSQNRYQPKFKIGDRVTGKWNKIPFVGSVLNDGLVSEDDGPVVSVRLDLPIKYKKEWKEIIFLTPREVKKFS